MYTRDMKLSSRVVDMYTGVAAELFIVVLRDASETWLEQEPVA